MEKETKYRPYLSGIEMQYIIQLINKENDGTMIAKKIKHSLGKVLFGANAGMAAPAYITNPVPTALAKLGESGEEGISCTLTIVQKREAAYIKYKGDASSCTPSEVELARTYMYENNMFSADEKCQYESEYLS